MVELKISLMPGDANYPKRSLTSDQ